MLDPDSDQMNADPQPCLQPRTTVLNPDLRGRLRRSGSRSRGRIQREKHCVWVGPYAGVDENLTLCRLQHV
jgi:hypothetical protein